MTRAKRFDAALGGTVWTGRVEAELERSAVAVPDRPGFRLTLLAPGRDLVPWGAEVPWYRPPRVGEVVEVAFEGKGVDLSVQTEPGPVLPCPWHLLDTQGSGQGMTSWADRVVGALAAATRFGAPWLEEFRAAVRALPRECTAAVSREMLDHAAAGRFPEALCEYVRALGDLWMPPREVRVLQNRVVTRVGPASGADMLAGVEAVLGRLP